ncbi:D-hexose-6-phosphate mutarotase [Georgenia sp. MJ206]|uniref:D-hexose-6-phosphate mutarotase n=1 Tax=Georgenia wangjunii TaxID=3117730 RepID=UPI002F2681FE
MATTDLPPAELPPSVRLVPGALDRLVVETPASTAEIVLQGAHVTAWAPRGAQPVLFTSTEADFEPGVPVRGGVPICFPWFGKGRDKDRTPQHGFARTLPWSLVAVTEEGDAVTVVLRLTDDEATRASAWAHPFEATYRVSVGQVLSLALEVRNTGGEPFTFEEALHTYFAVSDLAEATLGGLEGAEYVDTVEGETRREEAPVRLEGFADRVYPGSESDLVLTDPGHGRVIRNTKRRSRSTIVWNPGAANAAAMADFGDDEWPAMICAETGNVWDDAVELAPGESHTMTVELSVEDLDGAR